MLSSRSSTPKGRTKRSTWLVRQMSMPPQTGPMIWDKSIRNRKPADHRQPVRLASISPILTGSSGASTQLPPLSIKHLAATKAETLSAVLGHKYLIRHAKTFLQSSSPQINAHIGSEWGRVARPDIVALARSSVRRRLKQGAVIVRDRPRTHSARLINTHTTIAWEKSRVIDSDFARLRVSGSFEI